MNILAQDIYDMGECGFFDGRDTHAFFTKACGDPSPSGNVMILRSDAEAFIAEQRRRMEAHSPGAWATLEQANA